MATTELAERPAATPPASVGDIIRHDSFKQQLAEVLPRHCNPDRMTRLLIGAIRKNPKLMSCTPGSFMDCCRRLSSWGLEADGYHAHLIPYGKECTLVLDYKGIVALCYRSGLVQSIHADVVYSGDLFRFSLGRVQEHTPFDFRTDNSKPAQQGVIVAAYVIVKLKNGAEKQEVMTRAQVDAIKAKSKAGNSGPWVDHYAEMAKKTVFKRASKWLPLSAEIVEAYQIDHDTPDFSRQIADTASVGVAGLRDRLLPSAESEAEEGDAVEQDEPAEDTGPTAAEMEASERDDRPGTQRSMLDDDGGDSYYGQEA